MKLKNKFLLWVLVIALVPMLLMLIFSTLSFFKILDNFEANENEEYLLEYEFLLSNKLKNIESDIEFIENKILIENNSVNLQETLKFMTESHEEYINAFITDDLGHNYISYPENINQEDLINKEIVNNKDKKLINMTNVYFNEPTSSNYISIIKKVIKNDKIIGYVGISFEPIFFENKLTNNFLKENISDVYVVNNQGEIIYSEDKKEVGSNFYDTYSIQKGLLSKEKGIVNTGKNQMFFVRSSKDNELVLINNVSEKIYTFYKNKIILLHILIISIILALIFILYFFYRHPYIDFIKDLSKNMKKMLSGNLDSKVKIQNTNDELQDISENFNYFVSNVDKSIDNIFKNSKDINEVSDNLNVENQFYLNHLNDEVKNIEDISINLNSLKGISDKNINDLKSMLNEVQVVMKNNNLTNLMSSSLQKSIYNLNEDSKSAEDLIESINLISNKTNLLSLNARKEAKRAGEYGAGFSVISEEIRNLSVEISNLSEQAKIINSQMSERLKKGSQVIDLIIKKIEKSDEESHVILNSISEIDKNLSLEKDKENQIVELSNVLKGCIETNKSITSKNIHLSSQLKDLSQKIKEEMDYYKKG